MAQVKTLRICGFTVAVLAFFHGACGSSAGTNQPSAVGPGASSASPG